MARSNDRGTTSRRAPKDAGRRIKKKACALCKDHVEWVDYKDVNMLRKYMSDRGKIRARRVSGNCAQHQRDVALAIKTARELMLLPYTQRTTTERPGGRGRGGRDGGREGGREGGFGQGRRRRSEGEDRQGPPAGDRDGARPVAASGAGGDAAGGGAAAVETAAVETAAVVSDGEA